MIFFYCVSTTILPSSALKITYNIIVYDIAINFYAVPKYDNRDMITCHLAVAAIHDVQRGWGENNANHLPP